MVSLGVCASSLQESHAVMDLNWPVASLLSDRFIGLTRRFGWDLRLFL